MSTDLTSPAVEQINADEILELERLSSAQRDAAHAGQFEQVRLLLGTRQRILDGLRNRPVRPGDLDAVMAWDAETILVLGAEIRRVEEALSQLDVGGRALLGYGTTFAPPPAYLDHVR
jgi:hypothetical protein